MIRKHFTAALSSIVLLSTLCFTPTTRAQAQSGTASRTDPVLLLNNSGYRFLPTDELVPEAPATEKSRAAVQKMGLGREARVEVKLRDQTKVKGYVSAAEEDFFTVTDAKTGRSQMIRYAEVASVKKPGHGFSTATWLIIGAAATAALVIGITVVKPVVCDGGAQSRGLC